MLNAAILKISVGQTNTHTHKTTTVTLAAHAHRGLIIIIKIIHSAEAHIIVYVCMQYRSTLAHALIWIIIKCNALCVSKHVTESVQNIARGVGIN